MLGRGLNVGNVLVFQVNDEGGFKAFNEDWRFYFDCMLAPAARQTEAALRKLDLSVAPAPARTYTSAKGIEIVMSDLALLKGIFNKVFGKKSAPEAKGFGSQDSTESVAIKSICPLHGPKVEV